MHPISLILDSFNFFIASFVQDALRWLSLLGGFEQFRGQEFEEVHKNIGSLEIPKQVRIPLISK